MQQVRESNVSATAVVQQLVPFDASRILMVVGAPQTTPVMIGVNPATIGTSPGLHGIAITNVAPLTVSRDSHGVAAIQQWFVVTTVAQSVHVLEVFDLNDTWDEGLPQAAAAQPAPAAASNGGFATDAVEADPLHEMIVQLRQRAKALEG